MSISDEEQANSWKGLSNMLVTNGLLPALADAQNRTDRLDKLIVLMETQAQYMRPVPVAEPDPEREKEEDGPGSSMFISKFSLESPAQDRKINIFFVLYSVCVSRGV